MNDPYVTPPSKDPGPPQWDAGDLALATPEQISAALAAGQLRDLLAAPKRNSNSRSSLVGNFASPTTGEAVR